MKALLRVALALFVAGAPALADGGRPVQVHITEREPGAYLVQWRVPRTPGLRAIPSPVLPEGCRPDGERVLTEQPGGWLARQVYRCPDGIAGQLVGIRYPLHNPSLTTIFRVELLSGERFVGALAPEEESWRVPQKQAGVLAAWLTAARSSVLAGVRHVAGHGVHLALALVLILLGSGCVRWVTAFAAGQLAALGLSALAGRSFDPVAAEICVAVAVVFLAREALRAAPRSRRVAGIAAGAGLFHGLALERGGWSELVIRVLGMDAALLVLVLGGLAAVRLVGRARPVGRLRPVAANALGGVAVAFALALGTGGSPTEASTPDRARLPGLLGRSDASLPGSRRVAPQAAVAPVQSFLAVEPFEVRHEVLIRLVDLAPEIGLSVGADGRLAVDAQADVVRRLGELVVARTALEIDGEPAEGMLDRAGFMTADVTGVLPRRTAVPEDVSEALVGVTLVHPTDGMPRELELTWSELGGAVPAIPTTVIDPEASRAAVLTLDEPVLRWTNELTEDPLPSVHSVAVEAPRLPLPLVSTALLALAGVLALRALRGRQAALSLAGARVVLACALLAVPLARVSVALPPSVAGGVSAPQARRILAGVLPNVYRAFEFREESAVYDRLAVAVTGETLGQVYLEHRRALEAEERGGARARVDAVEVLELGALEPRAEGGFEARAAWTVGGTVTHFGHRHFRQNRYDARVTLVPVQGLWKLRSIEVLDQERLR